MEPDPRIPNQPQRWRLHNPATGRNVVLSGRPDTRYVDRDTGEELKVIAQLLPLAPSPSRLPWAEGNLRFCPSCDQLVPKDLNFCPYDGRPLPPLERTAGVTVDG